MKRNAQTFEVEPVSKLERNKYEIEKNHKYKTCSEASSVKMCIGNQLATQEMYLQVCWSDKLIIVVDSRQVNTMPTIDRKTIGQTMRYSVWPKRDS